MSNLFGWFEQSGFMPHGHCFLWSPDLVFLQVLSDSLIAIAYYSIPIALFSFASRRKDLQFRPVFVLFAIFIFLCGTTHLMDIWTIWHPDYYLKSFLKLVTGLVSVATAVLLWPLIPKALANPSPQELAKSNDRLTVELSERLRVERALSDLNQELERRVDQRSVELRQKADELKRTNSELQQFAYIASHDLREPLRTIKSYLELIERTIGPVLTFQTRRWFQFVLTAADRMQCLIDDLLTYSRLGSSEFVIEPVCTQSVCAETLDNLERAISESKAEIIVGTLPTVMGNRSMLSLVFQNLISNAIKFRQNQAPMIVISAAPAGRFWRFTVKDNGIGFDAIYAERVFRVFQRLHERDQYPGTGIGLAIVKRIVERLKGRVWVDSAENVGSSFFFEVPSVSNELLEERSTHDQSPTADRYSAG